MSVNIRKSNKVMHIADEHFTHALTGLLKPKFMVLGLPDFINLQYMQIFFMIRHLLTFHNQGEIPPV